MTAGTRHSSNTNDRGSAEQRRARKNWMLDVWGADVDVVSWDEWDDLIAAVMDETDYLTGDDINDGFHLFVGRNDRSNPDELVAVRKGLGRPACRCFRCGKLVSYETMEVDRIKPGAEGGKYVRNNIRPICPCDNKKLEGEARRRRNAKRKKRNEQARLRRIEAKVRRDRDAMLMASLGVSMTYGD